MKKLKIKNESSMDISADVYQWFNQHCCDVMDADPDGGIDDLKYNLEDADVSMFADEAMSVLVADYGWSSSVIEDYRDQIEYDLEKLIKDALDYIEYGDSSTLSFSKDKSDWMDRYRDNDEYTASLESRIRKLEKYLKNEDLDTDDAQMECARNVSFLAEKMWNDSADIIDQAEATGDEKLETAVHRMMSQLHFIQFYLNHKLR